MAIQYPLIRIIIKGHLVYTVEDKCSILQSEVMKIKTL